MVSMQSAPDIVMQYASRHILAQARRRDNMAGLLIAVGLTWPFLLSSVLPVPWWAYLALAMLGGAMRYRAYPRDNSPHWPVLLFVMVLLLYVLLAVVYLQIPGYGSEKAAHFLMLALAAYLVTFRQTPLTIDLDRGLRMGLAVTLLMALGVVYYHRNLFLETQQYGMEELRQLFAVTGFPLVIALAGLWGIPRTLRPLSLFAGAALLVLVAALEIFVRGRFAALTLSVLAVLLVLGPPWRHFASRLFSSCGLIGAFLLLYAFVLPGFGESYHYLEALLKNPMENRDLLYTFAWRGFMADPLGRGIGSFAYSGMLDSYPHNIFLEVAYELGLPGLLAVASMYLVALRRLWRLWLSPPHRMLAAMLGVMMLYMLKAGDIATWAFQWIYLYMLIVATPVAPTWPLLRGEALR
ncbi:MAG: hypothetical protein BWY76_01541 [bacterium ADurb.Bin429]|nr:MAG: hypothetical protein BWY76_01541 [bacterium ADurb.Bin429]